MSQPQPQRAEFQPAAGIGTAVIIWIGTILMIMTGVIGFLLG